VGGTRDEVECELTETRDDVLNESRRCGVGLLLSLPPPAAQPPSEE